MTVLESTERFTATRRQGGWKKWLALALVARQRGDLAMAEQYRQSAARALARKEETR